MGDPRGFLKYHRAAVPKRPIAQRIRDYAQVYEPLPLAVVGEQAARCMNCGVPFCNLGCPVNNLIPDWNDLVMREDWRQAIDRLHATNNFPEFTGALCPAPCEAACVLTINDKAVTIKEIERTIVERAFAEGWVLPQPPSVRTGRRVAVVGSGPAGLAAAQQLNRAGHLVTVFERDDALGGLLRYGIPDFKLEKSLVDRRLAQLGAEGIEFRPGVTVGTHITAAQLRSDFDAVLLAVGALQARDMRVPGRELHGVHLAMDYLTQQNRRVAGLPVDPATAISAAGKHVVILGGGDTSADCLGNVHREGAASVQVLTRGPKPPDAAHPLEWPDWPLVLHTYPAHEEGGERAWQVLVTKFSGENGHVRRLHLAPVTRGVDGTVVPARDEGERVLDADLVLLAIGFEGPVTGDLLDDLGVRLARGGSAEGSAKVPAWTRVSRTSSYTPQGAIETDSAFQTAIPGVFAAGDAHLGADLIVTAIAEGRKAARAIDIALTGASLLPA